MPNTLAQWKLSIEKSIFIASLRFHTVRARVQTTKLDICLIAVYCLIQFTVRLIARCNWKWTSYGSKFASEIREAVIFHSKRILSATFGCCAKEGKILFIQFSCTTVLVNNLYRPRHGSDGHRFICDHYIVSVRLAIPLCKSRFFVFISFHICSEK